MRPCTSVRDSMLLERKESFTVSFKKAMPILVALEMKHQCHPLSNILLHRHDDRKHKTEVFTTASQTFGRIHPLCVA